MLQTWQKDICRTLKAMPLEVIPAQGIDLWDKGISKAKPETMGCPHSKKQK